jgi:invasion protein IalB
MNDYTTSKPEVKAEPIVGHCTACKRDLTETELVPHPVISLPGMTHNVDDCRCGRLAYQAYLICDGCGARMLERDGVNGLCPDCVSKLQEVAA